MYGQTEATARMSYLPYDKSLEKYGSMGIAIPGGKFSLIDVDGQEITKPDTVGELVYEGPNVTLGYAESRQDLSKGDERHGVLVTGDMAKRDEDGFYYIVGRKKRFLKIYGNRVNLDECERMIQGHYEGLECACVGEDDHMEIYVTDSERTQDVAEYISAKTGLNKKAFTVLYLSQIPKNESGKKQYNALHKE
jgi:acyl-coenzyme A synthetase/AMP-(fatty) acid ligase